MWTKFGPEARDGDYVIVLDVDYMHRRAVNYIAKVYKGKAYTGVEMNSAKGRKFIHKKDAQVVIAESIVSEETKARIAEDIKSCNYKTQKE